MAVILWVKYIKRRSIFLNLSGIAHKQLEFACSSQANEHGVYSDFHLSSFVLHLITYAEIWYHYSAIRANAGCVGYILVIVALFPFCRGQRSSPNSLEFTKCELRL